MTERATRQALESARRRLAAAGCESPRLDAELLLAHVLGADCAQVVSDPARELSVRQSERFEALAKRRAGREPVAYVLGSRGFRHLELNVDRRVLVPRPETELLVEAALELPRGARVVDVGTGSGAVALALKHERPDLHVSATDVSPEALAVAAGNARRLGLEVDFRLGDLIAGPPGGLDAVVANLPYVSEPDWPGLPAEVARHEPRIALDGGVDGLALIRRLIEQCRGRVPFLALEVGFGQAAAVRRLLVAGGLRAVRTMRDLGGIERVVVGCRA